MRRSDEDAPTAARIFGGPNQVVRQVLLADRPDVVDQPVQRHPGRIPQKQECEEHRHQHGHLLLDRIHACGRREALLPDLADAHQDRRHEIGIVRGQIVHPADERRAAQFDRRREQRVEGEDERHRQQHRHAAAGRIDAALLVEGHQLLVLFLLRRIGRLQLRVALLNRFDLGLDLLHLPHRHDALVAQREENDVDDEGQDDESTSRSCRT